MDSRNSGSRKDVAARTVVLAPIVGLGTLLNGMGYDPAALQGEMR